MTNPLDPTAAQLPGLGDVRSRPAPPGPGIQPVIPSVSEHMEGPVLPVDFFRRMPGGGTVYVKGKSDGVERKS